MGLLDGKTAIVTGGGRGIGREEALLLASEGASVCVNDSGVSLAGQDGGVRVGGSAGESGGDPLSRPAEAVVDGILAAGGTAVANFDDVSTYDGAQRIVDQTVDAFGRLDILVNNAGILRDRMSFNLDEQDFDDVVRVHLKGHFAMSRAAGRHWRERQKAGEAVSGRIVNTTSEAGLFGSVGQANYAAAKGGIATLTLVLAREYERFGITVNAIAPRARTRMTEAVFGAPTTEPGAFDPLAPDNVAPVVVWLASDGAAGITGQIFMVWGGAVHLVSGFEPVASLEAGDRFTAAGLLERQDELFMGRTSGIRPFPLGA